eukprot:CAMPEP_0113835036 /NCGR_PEP_ID=MMETSP0328-20130328/8735_1 /TAXON_ID=39455 /ORGANISM="Alexandrium minutum" /LENGTH=63 /DNA_ID=CAMNT_0000803363 /DNA_START=50 /DNA_END=238 /DNA_ORIENTATION=- /assembly_acc=CAM_ASM_000350
MVPVCLVALNLFMSLFKPLEAAMLTAACFCNAWALVAFTSPDVGSTICHDAEDGPSTDFCTNE